MEQELQKTNAFEFHLNVENERLKASQVLVEDQLEKAWSLLAEAKEARTTVAAEVLERTNVMAKLQQDYKAEFVHNAEKKKELLSRIEFELAIR